MSDDHEKTVPLTELIREREARQKLESALADEKTKVNAYTQELSGYQKQLEEASKRLSMLDELHTKYTTLEQAHNQASSRYEKEIALADQGVTDREAREFALFKFEKSGQSDFQAWVETHKQSGAPWLTQQAATHSSKTLPNSVPRAAQPKADDELGLLANMNKDEKTDYFRKKFPQFAAKRA